jgi:hypothetical protein
MLDNLYFITPMPLVSTDMEVTGVFVTLQRSSHFAPLFPKKKLGLCNFTGDIDN